MRPDLNSQVSEKPGAVQFDFVVKRKILVKVIGGVLLHLHMSKLMIGKSSFCSIRTGHLDALAESHIGGS